MPGARGRLCVDRFYGIGAVWRRVCRELRVGIRVVGIIQIQMKVKVKMQHEGGGNNVLACKDLIDQKRVMSKKTISL